MVGKNAFAPKQKEWALAYALLNRIDWNVEQSRANFRGMQQISLCKHTLTIA